MTSKRDPERSASTQLVERILTVGVGGLGPLKGAEQIATEHRRLCRSSEDAVERVIRTHMRMVSATGFATGVGGFATLPITIPTDVGVFYVLSGRCAAAVAHLRGYDIKSEEVRSVVLLTLLGSAGAAVAADAGIKLGNRAAMAAVRRVPGRVLIDLNKKVGFRLATKAGEKGVVNLTKMVPVVGGGVGAGVNALSMRGIGKYAKVNFPDITAEASR